MLKMWDMNQHAHYRKVPLPAVESDAEDQQSTDILKKLGRNDWREKKKKKKLMRMWPRETRRIQECVVLYLLTIISAVEDHINKFRQTRPWNSDGWFLSKTVRDHFAFFFSLFDDWRPGGDRVSLKVSEKMNIWKWKVDELAHTRWFCFVSVYLT